MKAPVRSPASLTIVGLSLLVVVLVWIFVIAQIRHERDEAIRTAVRENGNRAIALEQFVSRTLEGADLATAYVADRFGALLESDTDPASVTKIVPLTDFASRFPALREINIVNAKGDLVATSVPSVRSGVNVAGRPLFERHRSDPSTALLVNPPSRSRLLDDWFVLLSRRVSRRDGSFGGTVSVQVHPSDLTDLARAASLSDHDLLSVIGLDGITRARRDGTRTSFGQDVRGTMIMQRQAAAPRGDYVGPSAVDGIVRYFSQRRVPRYGVFVVSGVSQAEVLRGVEVRARQFIFGASLFTIVVLALALLSLTMIWRRALRAAEIAVANQRLREAQQIARLGEWSFNCAAGTFSWSDELCKMYQRPARANTLTLDEFEGIFGRSGRETFQRVLNRLGEDTRVEFELAARLSDGQVSHRRLVAVSDVDVTGSLIGIHGTDQDITSNKLLISLQEQVSHLSRLDAYNAIAGTLAHELNQPLAAASSYLNGCIRLIESRGELDRSRIAGALKEASVQIVNAGDIIRRVRELFIDRRARSETVVLEDVIAASLELEEATRPGVSDVISVESEERVTAVGDSIQVQQVLMNLIANARQAAGSRDPRIVIGVSEEGQSVKVSVQDNGHGIPAELTDVFSPFNTTKSDGLGIGLAICRTLVEAMDGKIWVEGTGPDGTTVSFTLPRAAKAQDPD